MATISKTVNIDVDIDVDIDVGLDEFSTKELVEELDGRDDFDYIDFREQCAKVFEHFHQGRETEAIALMKKVVCDVTGRVL